MKKKMMIVCVSAILAGCSAQAQSSSAAADIAEDTEWSYTGAPVSVPSSQSETVYVHAGADGTAEKVTDSVVLSGIPEEGVVKDISNLTNVKLKSEETGYDVQDGVLYFQSNGKDIHYEGESAQQPPVSVNVQYFLNGGEITPENLAGKSGHLKVQFTYASSIDAPVLAMSVVFLDQDKVSDVTVSHGKLVEASSMKGVVVYGFPGLKEQLQTDSIEEMKDLDISDTAYFECDVENFELDFTETIFTDGLFDELNNEDLNNLKDASKSLQELGVAGNALVNASNAMQTGIQEYTEYLDQYFDANTKVYDSIDALSENLAALKETTSQLAQSISSDTQDSATLQLTVQNAQASIAVLEQVVSSLSSLQDILDTDEKLKDLTDTEKEELLRIVTEQIQKVDMSPLQQLVETMSSLSSLSVDTQTVTQGIQGVSQAVTQLSEAGSSMQEGTQQLRSFITSLKQGSSQLNSGSSSFTEGLLQLQREGLSKLTDKGSAYEKLLNNLQQLKEKDSAYTNFKGIQEGQKGNVKFLIETEGISKE